MEVLFDLVGTIIEKLKIKEIVVVLLLSGSVILFAPVRIVNILGLYSWRDEYRSYIGITVLICAALCLIWIAIWFMNIIYALVLAYQRRMYLKKTISDQEKEYLIINFYDFKRGEFKCTANMDVTSGNTSLLKDACIIERATQLARSFDCWAYCLQPGVRKYMNKAIKKKKITITTNGSGWKYSWRL